eukprot:46098_1
MNYQHHCVELQCPSTGDSVTVQLPSTEDSPDWASNLHFIIQAISNHFRLVSKLKESQWLFTINGMMVNRHDTVQFGVLLSKHVPPPAVLKIMFNASIVPSLQLHAIPQQTDSDTSSLINEIVDAMTTEEIHSLKKVKEQHSNNPSSHFDFKISWNHLMECIRHEMWPRLASVIKAMLDNEDEKQNAITDVHDLGNACVRDVVNILKTKRHLPDEECEYLTQLIIRAKQFDPHKYHRNTNASDMIINDHEDTDQMHGLSKPLCLDIYNVHNVLMFTNFNFREYTKDHFKTNTAQTVGQKWTDDASFNSRFNLYPV